MSDISDGSIDGEAADDGERSLTLERQTKLLLGELPHLDAYDVARMVGTSAARVLQFWRALGFPGVPASSKVFTRADADGLRAALDLIESSGLSETAWRALVRAAAHSADRLALWQLEALVEDAERRWVLDDTSARLVVLDTVGESVTALESVQSHAWRRHLLALLTRTEHSVGRIGNLDDDRDALPLERAIGFIDVVSYTRRTAGLGAAALGELVSAFEERARDVVTEVGDFVLKRADGCYTYQLAVVVDDGAQGITHVVRGMDLADNTARQVLLQQALGLPTPHYLHTPLVLGVNGEKLSKQNGAQALDTSSPAAALAALRQAAHALGLPDTVHTAIPQALAEWTDAWRNTQPKPPHRPPDYDSS